MTKMSWKCSKPSKFAPAKGSNTPLSSSFSSHLAMIELKQQILTSISKLSDRDTHQIAVQDLENLAESISNDGVLMLLNCLYEASNDPAKNVVKKECIRLIAFFCASHKDLACAHLTKIVGNIVKRLKDSDSGVRDACRDAIGSLSALSLKGEEENGGMGSIVSVFVKPLFEAMGEKNKVVQCGAALCMAKMIECALDPPVSAFQRMCPRVCKFLNSPNYMAKGSLLLVVSSLSQVGAISPQSMESLLQSIHKCIRSSDWATRKSAAETLISLAVHSSNLITEGAASTLAVLEASRFDKIKPVRDVITEAFQLWKETAGRLDGSPSRDGEKAVAADSSSKKGLPSASEKRSEALVKGASNLSSATDSVSQTKPGHISDKTAEILRKKAPTLSDKEPNLEFFQNLETRGSGDLPVEVVVPRRCLNNSNEHKPQGPEQNNGDVLASSSSTRELDLGNSNDTHEGEKSDSHVGISSKAGQSEFFLNNKLNCLAIQKQLLHLEQQQANLMNMLQNFMGGSHGSMATLENRVRGLEGIVQGMARDLSISSDRREGYFSSGLEGSSFRHRGKHNRFPEYTNAKLGRGDLHVPLGERYLASSNGPRRSDPPENWDFHCYANNGHMGTKKSNSGYVNNSKIENYIDQVGNQRGWDKTGGPVRFGEGPSARSIWQASKDKATLEAIRGAGEDRGASRGARVPFPELTVEALTHDGIAQECDPVWTSWSNALNTLHAGGVDIAFAEVLSTGNKLLLLKLMGRCGPVIDQLSNETANETLHAVSQFLLDQNLLDICLSWVQQLIDIAVENGPDALETPLEIKQEILLNLNEAASSIDPSEEWEGATPYQLMFQLATAWEMDLQDLEK
ncbi:hypothetical protein Leryth_022225 [Lithospermum erythrorhizon]|nr:hypothetical protein Leryth_022225 [Lithospermum erythrorhizon]